MGPQLALGCTAHSGPGLSALHLPPAPASQSSTRRTLLSSWPAPGFQSLLLWFVYCRANLDGQQVRGKQEGQIEEILFGGNSAFREGDSSHPTPTAPLSLSSQCTLSFSACCAYRLPLVQAPSFEFLIPALVLASQKPYQATWAPGNNSRALSPCVGTGCPILGSWDEALREVSGAVLMSGLLQGTLGLLGGPGRLFLHFGPLVLAPSLVVVGLSAHKEVALFCSTSWGLALLPILLIVVCSQHLGSCLLPLCPLRTPVLPTHTHVPVFRLFSVLLPVICVWILSALLGLSFIPQKLSAPNIAPWLWLPHPGGWSWPKLTLRGLAAGTTMALASSTSSLCCYALCGRLLQLSPPPSYACSRGLGFEGLGSLLAALLGSPLGIASSFPNVGTTSLTQAGSHRVARLVSLLSIGLGLSPRLAQALTTIPLPVHGAVLGVNQAVILSTGFSYFYFTDIDSGRNVFIVGFAVFMALLLPRWLQDAPVLNTGLSPVDVLLCSFLAEPVLLAGLLSFLLENTIPGTRLERGLPSPKEAQTCAKPRKDALGYELPAPFQTLCSFVPQPLRCLCSPAEDAGDEERGPSEPRETAGLLPSAEDLRLGLAVTRAD
ncbi:solute carrier family 23 member 3 isoform X2 [Phascolarctos cinereus]|uniref:Solute carrier family 23 member 3 isoform X1 n=1 Tax=Phascolarctos cinereus TaxID=38626 RepID=A0A6P5LJY1_PHACI|nr:solute carrier family 23 member 3 isoform X1 [Phascolarctos cinereus]